MTLSLSHVAECVLARIANQRRDAFMRVTGLAEDAEAEFIRDIPELASCEAHIEPVSGRAFDGACRVDVVVRIHPGAATACELKLGTTGLGKTRVNKWLRPCMPSHGNRRWSGNAMAVLERQFSETFSGDLIARVGQERLRLTPAWVVVARRQVLRQWEKDPPNFSGAVRKVAFEDIVERFGGRQPFNALIREMLDVDYFEQWVLGESEAG